MKHYFLGLAANYSHGKWLRHLFTIGTKKDYDRLRNFLGEKYDGEAVLCKNGRSALALALKAYFKPGEAVLVNGFTCYAVYEAVKAAGLKPVFVDIEKKTLNQDLSKVKVGKDVKGIIIQNTLGNPVDIEAFIDFSKKHDLIIIEDLAHSAGISYPDGQEVGTVGAATVLSFGKDKAIDTISGGAVVFRIPSALTKASPSKPPRVSDHLRARFYPMFGALCRTLSYVHLGGAMMKFLVAIHFVEKSADNKLDLKRTLSKFEAKLALKQLKHLDGTPIREFYLVDDRKAVLRKLHENGYYFSNFWYEKPVSPIRYYNKVHFNEEACPNAVFVSEHIVNVPNYYSETELDEAREIIKEHLIEDEGDGKER